MELVRGLLRTLQICSEDRSIQKKSPREASLEASEDYQDPAGIPSSSGEASEADSESDAPIGRRTRKLRKRGAKRAEPIATRRQPGRNASAAVKNLKEDSEGKDNAFPRNARS